MSVFNDAKELKEQASIVGLLANLGYKPVKKSGKENVYHSMLRQDDNTPSFTVDDILGVWFDHGMRKGGNIIDFGLAYWQSFTFNEVVCKLQEVCALTPTVKKATRPRRPVKIPHYIIEEIKDPGTHPAITGYLEARGVFDIGKATMSEIYYYVEDQKGLKKHFFAAGWQNENGGWEVRNKYFKGCLGHKAITFIEENKKDVAVFEGYINYLSWKCQNPEATESVIVLNSLALLPVGIEKAKLFSGVGLYLDRDQPGHSATTEFIKALPYAIDRSNAYEGFNDYNDMLVAGLSSELKNTLPRGLKY